MAALVAAAVLYMKKKMYIKAALTLSAIPFSKHNIEGSVLPEGFHYLYVLSVHFFFFFTLLKLFLKWQNPCATLTQPILTPSVRRHCFVHIVYSVFEMLFCSQCIIVKCFPCNRWKYEMTT